MLFKKKITWCVLTILWLGLMFFLSHQNGPDTFNTSHGFTVWLAKLLGVNVEWLHGVVRKTAHVVLYLVLVLMICGWQVLAGRKMWLALALAIVFSVIDEGTKPLVVGRHCDIEDILLNDMGAVLGYVIARFIKLDRRLD
ncbi:VanZ family protein [Anaerovibrio lipolyticus]|uniref:VanZ family protein n=1 Tax=Anaerovibrio lipolyticus TaxID=82374 RepID=UPI00048553D4|nr:VanZ family protein [Anaerovibrio lipolyticus]